MKHYKIVLGEVVRDFKFDDVYYETLILLGVWPRGTYFQQARAKRLREEADEL